MALTKYQIGGTSGHHPQEHIFTIKSVRSLYDMLGITVFMSLWDIRKFFDKENLRDGMNAVHCAGVSDKLYNVWFMLNERTKIRLRTGAGMTKYQQLSELIGQGTLGGAVISGLNIDMDVNHYFETSSEEQHTKPTSNELKLRLRIIQ